MLSLVFLFYLFWGTFNHQADETLPQLIVDVVHVKDEKGEIIACLSTNSKTFLDDCFQSSSTKVIGDVVQIKFDDLAPGAYALAVFQDLNGNGILDKNGLQLPTEPFGFSNNPRLFFGPPSHRRCAFQVDSANAHLTVKLKRI